MEALPSRISPDMPLRRALEDAVADAEGRMFGGRVADHYVP